MTEVDIVALYRLRVYQAKSSQLETHNHEHTRSTDYAELLQANERLDERPPREIWRDYIARERTYQDVKYCTSV
jgi:hypothetical protein